MSAPTGPPPAPATSSPGTPSSPTSVAPRRPGRRRVWLITAAVVLVTALLAVVVAVGVDNAGGLAGGPQDTAPTGHGALGKLLEDQDIVVDETRRFATVGAAAGPDTTILIDDSEQWLDEWTLERLLERQPGRIVILDVDQTMVEQADLPVRATRVGSGGATVTSELPAECTEPAALRAGTIALPARSWGLRPTDTTATACYPVGEPGWTVLRTEISGVDVVMMPRIGENQLLASQGNASLAMQLLGAHPRLVWWQPEFESSIDGGVDRREFDEIFGPSLLPPTWIHAALLAVAAVVAMAVWRGRRLGPILTERLPVVIPAAETVEGHGRMYARLGARARAATAIREASRGRLSRLLGHADDPEALAAALATRTGRDHRALLQLLAGPAPADDGELVALKRGLDQLEQEARRP